MAAPNDWSPRKAVLFNGHMVDAPGREKPRFPPDKEPVATAAIAAALADLGLGTDDLAICGGDLLFAEAALARGARLELYIPFEEPMFLEKSVDFADSNSRGGFFAAGARPCFMSRLASLAWCQRARIHTSATTAGC